MLNNWDIVVGKNIKKTYDNISVLDIDSIHIEASKVTSIVGPSGAGKSTLLHILGTLLEPSEGELWIDNTNIIGLPEKKLAEMRNKSLGFVFQFHNLLPEFNALENVSLPAMIAQRDKKDYEKKATELLQYLGLKDRIHHKPSQLSGGEQQRVAIARALINEPKLVFADEPTGNLDTKNALELHKLFVSLKQDFGYSFLIVTHNKEMAEMSDTIIEMKDGTLV